MATEQAADSIALRVRFGAVLLGWQTETSVWAASAESGGNAFADQGDLRDDFVDEIVETLREDGLLAETGPQPIVAL